MKRTLPLRADLQRATRGSDVGRLQLERARARLGGPAAAAAYGGRLVEAPGAAGLPVIGVVLHQTEVDVDVWLGDTLVRRVKREHVTAIDTATREVSDEMLRASADARRFCAMERDTRVRYDAGGGAIAERLLFEWCRFGALVARDDGCVMAGGFRRLWPGGTAD